MNKPLVSVIMITYKHELYIKQAIEGVLMQDCDFDVELIVADDHSPDKTEDIIQEIIEHHPNGAWIKYKRHSENVGVQFNFMSAMEMSEGQYIAICEGDDYWKSPHKLQKQVEFLNNHKDYGLVGTKAAVFDQISKEMTIPKVNTDKEYSSFNFEDVILGKAPIYTLTVLFRKKLIEDFYFYYISNPGKLSGFDNCLWMFFSYKMKVAILNKDTAVYRKLPNSLSAGDFQNQLFLKKKLYRDFQFFKQEFKDIDPETFKLAEYYRAQYYYVLALLAKDYPFCEELSIVFLENKDYTRNFLLKLALKWDILIKLPLIYEWIGVKIRKFKL